jgi:hypothetical protein
VHLAPPSKAAAAEPVQVAEPLPIPEAEAVVFAEAVPAAGGKRSPVPVPVIIGLVLVLSVGAIVGLAALAGGLYLWGEVSAEAARHKQAIPRDEFEQKLRAAQNREEVISLVGKPSVTFPEEQSSGERWFYDDKVKDPTSGIVYERAIVKFKKEKDGWGVEKFEYVATLWRVGR